MNVSGEATTETTISGLNAATNYSIEVAALNSVGTGEYSDPITSLTFCKLLRQHVPNQTFFNIFSFLYYYHLKYIRNCCSYFL